MNMNWTETEDSKYSVDTTYHHCLLHSLSQAWLSVQMTHGDYLDYV